MNNLFCQKEMDFIKELKGAEQICVAKYQKYAQDAIAPELKNLFTDLSQQEQHHLQTLSQMEQGIIPSTKQQGKAGGSQAAGSNQALVSSTYASNPQAFSNDSYLLSDALSTEKHVSANYDIGIFEFKNSQARDLLNGIQKQEQVHGKTIYDYMAANGMYN